MVKQHTLALTIFSAALALSGCGGGSSGSNNQETGEGGQGKTPADGNANPGTPDTAAPTFAKLCQSDLTAQNGPQLSAFHLTANMAENEAASPSPLLIRSDIDPTTDAIRIRSNGFPNLISSVCTSDGKVVTGADEIRQLFDLVVDPANGDVQLRLRKTLDFEQDSAFYQINLTLGQQQQKVLLRLHDVQQGTATERLKISSFNELKSFFNGKFVSDNIGNDIIDLQYSRLDGGSISTQTCPDAQDGSNPVQHCSRLHIALDRDIDASPTAQTPWQSPQLIGSLDGQQHVISNLNLKDRHSFINSPTRFSSYAVSNLGLLNVNFNYSVFTGSGSNNLTRVFVSGTATGQNGYRQLIVPFGTGGQMEAVYSNVRYDLRAVSGDDKNTQVDIGGLVAGTSSPLTLRSGYSNGAVITAADARFPGTFTGLAPSNLNEGLGFSSSLFYSAMAFNVSGEQAIRFQDDSRRIPYFSIGGISGRHASYPSGNKDSAYNWRFISDRSGNSLTPILGNADRDTNNDGIADEFAQGADVSAAGLTQQQVRMAASFSGAWNNGTFDITDGEYPVLKNMPYPHIAGASWMSAADPGIAYQRLNYDRYLVIDDIDPEPANNGGDSGNNDDNDGDNNGNGGNTNPDGNNGSTNPGNGGGDNDGSGNNNPGTGVTIPAAVDNCQNTPNNASYQGDGPNPNAFHCVVNLAENTATSEANPYTLRLVLTDSDSVLRTRSGGFPNRISRVQNHLGLNINEQQAIAELFSLSVNPLNGEVRIQLNKQLDFEHDGGFFQLTLSLGSSTKNVLVRVHDVQHGNAAEALKLSSYNELKSFMDGEFISDNIGFDLIELKHTRLDGIVNSSCDTEQEAAHNCSNMRVALDRDIDASASAATPWQGRMLHGAFDGQRHMIRNLTLADHQHFLYSKNRFSSMWVGNLGLENMRLNAAAFASSTATLTHVSVQGEVQFPNTNYRLSFAPFAISGTMRAVYSNLNIDLSNLTQQTERKAEISGLLTSYAAPLHLASGYSNGIIKTAKDRNQFIEAAGLSTDVFLSGQWSKLGNNHLNNSLFYSAMAFDFNDSQAIRFEDSSRRIPFFSAGGLGISQSSFYPDGDKGSSDYNWRFINNRGGNNIERHVGNFGRDTNNDGMADSFATGIDVSNAALTEAEAKQANNFSGRWINSDFDITDGEFPVLKNMPYPHTPGATWLNADDPGVAYQRATFNQYMPQN